MIDLDRARELLSYNPETGLFLWKITSTSGGAIKAGNVAGYPSGHVSWRYWMLTVGRQRVLAHRLAIAFTTGSFPPKGAHVDHINGDSLDNRISNLRVVTPSINAHNRRGLNRDNTSGYRGVSFDKKGQFWKACIQVNCRSIILGRYKTLEEAVAAR